MRLRDESKRKLIVETAVRLFAEQSFNKVRLDDVADAAGVGKGTVYIYFKNKEDLYYSVVYEGFAEVVEKVRQMLGERQGSFVDKIYAFVSATVDHGMRYPQYFEVLRTVGIADATSQWEAKRKEFCQMLEDVIRQGVAAGEFVDSRPDRTSVYMHSMIRAVMLYGPRIVDAKDLTDHITGVVLRGIVKRSS